MREGHGFESVSARVSFRISGFLPQSNDMQVMRTGASKFPVGVNVSVNVCPSACVSLVRDSRHVQGVPYL